MTPAHDARFDARLRGIYRYAASHLSPALQRQLCAPHTAMPPARARHDWRIGLAFASLAALALTLTWWPRTHREDALAPSSRSVMHTTGDGDGDAILDPLAMDPEFYAWIDGTTAQETAP